MRRWMLQLEDLEEQMKRISAYLENQQRIMLVLDFMELPFHEESMAELLDRENRINQKMKDSFEEVMRTVQQVTRTMQWTHRFI